MPNGDTVRSLFEAYLAQDRSATEALLDDDFVFTSSQVDHIDENAYRS